MKRYGIFISLVILVLSLPLCGFLSFAAPDMAMDTTKHHIYKCVNVAELVGDTAAARQKYENDYLLVTGLYEGTKTEGFSIMDSSRHSLICTVKAGVNIGLGSYSHGDSIGVYGKCTFDLGGNMRLSDAEKIIKAPVTASDEVYFTIDGKSYDKSRSLSRSVVTFDYVIPPLWEGAEINIKEAGLGTIEGYQYVLNSLTDKDVPPESFFVCYFDKKLLVNPGYISLERKVQQAVIKNITGGSPGWPHNVLTYYGQRYACYSERYNTPLGDGYHAEYIFVPDGGRGMLMMLYVYRETHAIDDVMYTARFAHAAR